MIMQGDIGFGDEVDTARVMRVLEKVKREARLMTEHLAEAARGSADASESGKWICINVENGREFSVQKLLSDAEIHTLVPCEKVFQKGRGKGAMVETERVFLPNYVLVRCLITPAAMDGLLRVKHVLGIIGGAISPHVIHEQEVMLFKQMAEGDKPPRVTTDKSICQGIQCDIEAGPFSGFLCVVLSVKWCRQARARVRIVVSGKPFEVEMPVAFLKRV